MIDYTIIPDFERRYLRDNRKIIISGDIDECSEQKFIEDIHVLIQKGSKEPITIIISSLGGSAFSGLAIIRAIRVAKKQGIKVVGEVHGYACSMSFLILQCCDDRIMGELDMLMAHGITTGFIGDMKNMDAENKLLSHWHHEFAELIACRCVGEYKEPSYWYEILRDNTPQWYTSTECIEMGLVDKVDADNKN